jgi:transcriptional regulator with PAS, ATPase and Fis domain
MPIAKERETGKQISGFSDDALEMMVNFNWPGNVLQLPLGRRAGQQFTNH